MTVVFCTLFITLSKWTTDYIGVWKKVTHQTMDTKLPYINSQLHFSSNTVIQKINSELMSREQNLFDVFANRTRSAV